MTTARSEERATYSPDGGHDEQLHANLAGSGAMSTHWLIKTIIDRGDPECILADVHKNGLLAVCKKSMKLAAAVELAKRLAVVDITRGGEITSHRMAKDFLRQQIRHQEHETFNVLYLDSKHQVIHYEELFRGTIDCASVPVREVIKESLKHNAAAIIVAHNHPSGNAQPSNADKSLTETINLACNLMGINLLDHFIIADDTYSFAEHGEL